MRYFAMLFLWFASSAVSAETFTLTARLGPLPTAPTAGSILRGFQGGDDLRTDVFRLLRAQEGGEVWDLTSHGFARFDLSGVDRPVESAELRFPVRFGLIKTDPNGEHLPVVVIAHAAPTIESNYSKVLSSDAAQRALLDTDFKLDIDEANVYGSLEIIPAEAPGNWIFISEASEWTLPEGDVLHYTIPLNSVAIAAINARVGQDAFAAGFSLNLPDELQGLPDVAELSADFPASVFLDLTLVPEPSSLVVLGVVLTGLTVIPVRSTH